MPRTAPDDATGPSADLVRVYLSEVGRTPLLTAEEEVELAKRIEAGLYADELLRRRAGGDLGSSDHAPEARDVELRALAADGRAAKDHMLRANLRLVVSVAKKNARRGLPFLDVVQEGNLGLIRAVEKFDYAKGYKFSTYATWWIRQSIGRGSAEQSRVVRLPVHVQDEVAKVVRAERALLQELGRTPSDEEVAAHTGHDPSRVQELRRVAREPVSLDAPVGEEGDTVLADLVLEEQSASASDVVEQEAVAAGLDQIVGTLPQREAFVVRMRFGLHDGRPHTLDEIGRELGLTRERVRQLEKSALARLREPDTSREVLDLVS